MKLELLIKAKSLATEARHIRAQELKLKGKVQHDAERENLHQHRVGPVRREARLTHLARAYLRGMPYRAVEGRVRPENLLWERDYKRIASMVNKYGPNTVEWTEVWGWAEAQAKAA